MSLQEFKDIYGELESLTGIYEKFKGTFENLDASGKLEEIIEKSTGEKVNLKEDSAKTRQAKFALNEYIRTQKKIVDYTKKDIDNVISGDKQEVIKAAALGIKHDPRASKLASYLYAYNIVDILKEDERDIQEEEGPIKRKKRLSGEQRGALVDMVLPLIVKERIRGKVQDAELDSYATSIAYVAALSDRSYVAQAFREGQELLGKRIENIGGVEAYIKGNLKTDEDYLLFARSLGEAHKEKEDENQKD